VTRDLVIENVAVFDGEARELRDGPVVIREGVITAVGDADGSGLPTIDGKGGVVVPGLIDAHFHAYGHSLDLPGLEAPRLSYTALAATPRLRRALRRGFTTVRDVAGGDGGLARAIAEGLVQSPRYLFTGAALSQTGGHGDGRAGDWDLCSFGGHTAEVVDGVDALRVAVRERFRQGAHAIKLLTCGGVVSPTDPLRIPQYSEEEIAAVCVEARRRGSYVAAHAYSPEAIVHSVANGVRSIEHGNLLDDESARLMADHDAYLVPTLVTYDAMARRGAEFGMHPRSQEKNREVLERGLGSLETAQRAGVPVAFGTDLMGPLESEQLAGLRLQVEALGAFEALLSATSRCADLLNRPDLGRVRPGAAGDVLVLAENPLDRPSALWSVHRRVIQGGCVVQASQLV
jgi:imidazolonepropionase-like amidohydrolase